MDYTTFASESMLEDQRIRHIAEYKKMALESHFILEAMDTGVINLYANLDQPTIVAEGVIIDAISDFLEKIVSFFRNRSVQKSKKYSGWIKDNKDVFKDRAKNHESFQLREYWNADWKAGGKDLENALKKAADNYKNKNYDYKYANKLIGDEKILIEGTNVQLADALKNYFRFGEATEEMPAKVNVTGEKLATLIDGMVEYCLKYESDVIPMIENLSKTFKKTYEDLKKSVDRQNNDPNNDTTRDTIKDADDKKEEAKKPDEGTKESITLTPDTMLTVEERTIKESILKLAVNYNVLVESQDIVLEAKNKKKNNNKPTTNDDKKDDQGSPTEVTTTDSDGDPEDSKKEENKTETEQKIEDAAEDKKKEEEAEAKKEDSDYINNIQRFTKYGITAITAALEERFVLYVNVFKAIGGEDGKGPKFDKEGRYIGSKQDAGEALTDADDNLKLDKAEKGLLSKFKKKFKNAKNARDLKKAKKEFEELKISEETEKKIEGTGAFNDPDKFKEFVESDESNA